MKEQSPIKRFKVINCKWEEKGIICNKSCNSGKRGFCDRHYAVLMKKKALENAKKLRVKEKAIAKRTKKRETITATKLWTLTSQLLRTIKPLICCTCSKKLEYSTAQAGHFRSRRFGPTKYDLRNLNPQCKSCNVFYGGFEYEHACFIKEKYGESTLDLMVSRSKNLKFKIGKTFLYDVYHLYNNAMSTLANINSSQEKETILKELVEKYEEIYLEHDCFI